MGRVVAGRSLLARQCGTFTPNKHLALVDPQLAVTVEEQAGQLAISVAATSLARFVELALDGAAYADVVFSDNYFDVPAGKTVTVTCPLARRLDAGRRPRRAARAVAVRFVRIKPASPRLPLEAEDVVGIGHRMSL